MKTPGLVVLIMLISCAARAQLDLTVPNLAGPGTSGLSNDPVFNGVLSRRVSYPIKAIRAATYGRIYAGFDIDTKGHVQNITILSPTDTGVGFEQEVRAALKRMPPLNPRYAGQYALPVAFIFTNWNESTEPHRPTNTLSRLYFRDRLLLGEIIFRAEVRSASTYVPLSNQITYY